LSPDMPVNDRVLIKQISRIVSCLTRSNDIRSMMEEIHSVIAEMLYAENFYVVLVNDGGALHFPYFVDAKDDFSEETLNALSLDDIHASLTYFALTSTMDCNFNRKDIENLQAEGLVNVVGSIPEQWMSFPLVVDESSLGAFIIQSYRDPNEYSDNDVELLKGISHVVSSAITAFQSQEDLTYANMSLKAYQTKLEELIKIRTETIEQKKRDLEEEVSQRKELQGELENKVHQLQSQIAKNLELQRQLEHQATHDHLTGLANRHELNNVINRLAAKMQRAIRHVYLLFIDLDGFKAVNDTLGHDAGDLVLVEVSKRIQKMVRGYDLVARIGGDEFVVLIESVDENQFVNTIAERIVRELALPIMYEDQEANIGASIGIAESANAKQILHLITDADHAMYEAKRSGKGQVVWFSQEKS